MPRTVALTMNHDRRSRLRGAAASVFIALAALLFPAGPAHPVGEEISDENIRKAVEDEIAYDRIVRLDDIDVAVNSGVAVLTGEVNNILAKDRAARIARTVKGVRAVDNRIDVDPPADVSEPVLRDRVKNALLADPASDEYEISVAVEGNRVVLAGVVESWQEKILAEKVAKSVKGVASVSNEIETDYTPNRSDAEIEADVEQRLAFDVLVDHGRIEVEVEDAVVRLTGVAGSAAEKNEAVADAWVAGVADVDAADLKVEKWARDPRMVKGKYTMKSDAAVADAVEKALTLNPRVKEFDVAVEVEDGSARLFGVVDNPKAKQTAGRLARRTVGVTRVVNRIRVRPLEEDVDSGLRERVRKALADDPYLEGRQIDAVAVDGTIYLHGVVESFFEKAQAEDAVASVKGVRAVKNNITVHDLTVNYDPYVDGDYVYEIGPMGPTDLEPAFLSDTQIKENVVEQFYWSPYVDLEQIRITVEDAVVTLTGDVDSWKERVFARQEAYEAGAANVIDRLDVEKSGN